MDDERIKLLNLLRDEKISPEAYHFLKEGLLGKEGVAQEKQQFLDYWERTRQEREDYIRRHDINDLPANLRGY